MSSASSLRRLLSRDSGQEEGSELSQSWRDVFASSEVDNIGSAARDYCGNFHLQPRAFMLLLIRQYTARSYLALERTYLSHVRLGLVLLALSASILFHSRFPRTETTPQAVTRGAAVPMGSLYATAALATIIVGALWYDHGAKRMRLGLGVIEVGLRYVYHL